MTAAELASSIPVSAGETLSAARVLEDAALASAAPQVRARLRAIDRDHDRAIAALRARYRERESAYDEDWPDPPRDIWGLDAAALVITAIALAVVIASARFADRWDAPSAAALCAGLIVLATVLHLVGALRSRSSAGVSNQRASSVIGFDAVAAVAGAGLIIWRANGARGGAPFDAIIAPVVVSALCGLLLAIVWVDARRRGAPERARVARYRVAEASWREDLDAEASELADRSRAAALAVVQALDAESRAAVETDLAEAALVLKRRDDVPPGFASAIADSPFGALRYDDRV
ncbi:MAG: hypothetical protein Q7T15_05870 [Microcella sp.]|uniref:hypothetical protein n=1 Tax=Microcella sp. TaxID=1913979 RepID=UPI002721BF86|nr:hypothetical protein [Microcella sp.]MDO8337764.1 hypothetical protein [Microcella sp.]